MRTSHHDRPAHSGQAYAALRHGGASQARARAELALSVERAAELEARFRVRRPGEGPDAMRPRFARHQLHVATVLKQGGYPAIPR
jgi:hypothetical protein